jgi:hypothetical protein
MSQNEMHFDVAITGAGFSGTMVAVSSCWLQKEG